MVVEHTLIPWYTSDSNVLVLGTIPSVKSRELNCYYGHPQNRFWKTMEAVFEETIAPTAEARKQFVLKHKIALWDVLSSCDIEGSMDASIKDSVPNDIPWILKITSIKQIYTTGTTAKKLYDRYILPKTEIPAILLPSTSPANRRWANSERLVEEYYQIRRYLEEL